MSNDFLEKAENKDATKKASARKYAGVSEEVRTNERKRKILDAAFELFGTQGYRATSIREICRLAGLNDRYFYQSFESSERLLLDVYKESVDKVNQGILGEIARVLPNDDVKQVIIAGLTGYFRASQDPRIVKICWLEISGVSQSLNEAHHKMDHEWTMMLILLAKTFFKKWTMSDDESYVLATAITGAIGQTANRWLLDNYRIPLDEMVNYTSRIMFSLLKSFDVLDTD